jgi:putative phage-type endonuclease
MNAQLVPLSPTRGYIGGGNIAGILGLSPFKTPLDEYLTITNEMPVEISPERLEFFEDRRDLEPWAAKKFTRKTKLQIVRRNTHYDDAEFDWAKAEIDFEPENDSNGETKTVHPNALKKPGYEWGDPDLDEEPPFYVTAQAMWGLGVTRRQKCYVHALIGFDDQRIYEIHRDETTIANIRAHAARFWKYHVLPRRMPQPTTVEDLLRLYQRDSGRAVEADTEIQLALTELHRERQTLKLHTTQKELLELQIKKYMRDATTLTCGGMSVASWKADTRGIRIFRLR